MMPLRPTGLLAAFILSGCTATAIMVGEAEPRFDQIRPGDTRPNVERILGQKKWKPGYADGLSYEIYQFKAGRPPSPLLGTAAYTFDVLTLGALEFGYRPNELAPLKQIAVTYDASGRVRSVSKPWPVKGFGACARMRSTIPAEAGIPSVFDPDLKGHPVSTTLAPAQLVLDRPVNLDGRWVNSTTVQIHPGRRELSFQHYFIRRGIRTNVSLTFEAVSGHQYRLREEDFWPYLMNLLVENVDSEETLDCVEVRGDSLPAWIEAK